MHLTTECAMKYVTSNTLLFVVNQFFSVLKQSISRYDEIAHSDTFYKNNVPSLYLTCPVRTLFRRHRSTVSKCQVFVGLLGTFHVFSMLDFAFSFIKLPCQIAKLAKDTREMNLLQAWYDRK